MTMRAKLLRAVLGIILVLLVRKGFFSKHHQKVLGDSNNIATDNARNSTSKGKKQKKPTKGKTNARALSIRVGSPRTNESKGSGYSEFPVTVVNANGSILHTEWRRYSQFVELNKAIGNRDAQLPAKKVFGKTEEVFLEQRRVGLELFLQQVFLADPSCASAELQSFLGWASIPAPLAAASDDVHLQNGENDEDESEEEYEDEVEEQGMDRLVATMKTAYTLIDDAVCEGPQWTTIVEGPSFSAYLKTNTPAGVISTKGVGEIPAPIEAVFALLQDTSRKPEFEKDFESERILEEIDAQQMSAALGRGVFHCSIRHVQSASKMPKLLAPRDSVVTTCRERCDDGRIFIAVRSVVHDDAPEQAAYVRANVLAVGIILTPLGERRTGWINTTYVDLKGNVAPPMWIIKRILPKDSVEKFELITKACCDETKWPESLAALRSS